MAAPLYKLKKCPCCETAVSSKKKFGFLFTFRFKCAACESKFAPTQLSSAAAAIAGFGISALLIYAVKLDHLPSLIIGATIISVLGLFLCPLGRIK